MISQLLIDDLRKGQEYWGVLAELIIDPETNRRRVITLSDQIFPANVFIECSKLERENHDIGTVFKVNIGVSIKTGRTAGRLYVHSLKKQELLTVDEWETKYGD